MNKKIFTSIICIVSVITANGQDNIFTNFKTKFPDEPAVFVERSEVMNIEVSGDSLKIYSDVFEDILHMKEQTESYASKRVYGSHFNQVENIKAKTLLWEKNRYKEMNVSEFRRNSDRASGIFFDDSYYYSFNFPSVATQNRTQLEYREVLKNPRFISGYIFPSYLSQGKSSFVIKTTKDVEIVYQVLHDEKSTIKFKKTEKGSNVTYEWTSTDVPLLRNEAGSPSLRYVVPHVICYVKSYETKKGKVKVLETVSDLYAWYYSLVRDVNNENSEQLVSIVNEIKSKSKDELDVVRNVFYWVQNNIKYIAFEQGMRGFIPNSGSYVCEKRYGDCKDMANMIVNMLKIAGVTAHHTWIGTRDLPYRYSQVPTPLVDNHMIATYISKNGDYYFLDATGDYTPFGYPSSMIQGKEALISIDEKNFVVKEVPVIPMEKSVMTDSMKVTIDNNTIVGKGSSSLTGFAKVFGSYELDRAEQTDVKKYITKLVGKGSNKFFLDNYRVANLQNRHSPIVINYDFRISDYAQKISDELFINLNLNKDMYNEFINMSDRKFPYENEYLYVKDEFIELSIPDGYAAEYVPEAVKINSGDIGCEISYAQNGNTINYHKRFYLNYLLLAPERFEAFNSAVKKFSEAYKESVILKKK
jgi:transglutaminase-like putative cysteine protease